jgi:zinc/manganese transport system ATP-binding protein/zinc transport system ATP-binding protein
MFAGVIGPSGAGKTTLLKSILGLAQRMSGDIVVNGQQLSGGKMPSGIGYVPQVETVDWSFPATVEQVILMGLPNRIGRLPWLSSDERERIDRVMDDLGIPGLRKRHIRDLSGGQQHRVFLARALVGDPGILILDEPTASVDIKTRDDILHHLAHLNQAGTTILMTTHELNSLAAHLPWVICVNRGVIAQGSPTQVFTDAILSRTFNAEMRVVTDPVTGNLLVAEAGDHPPLAGLERRAS